MSAGQGPRVVSLVPSVTETLLAWGVTPVACTRFCEQPALAHVGGTKDPDVAAIVDLHPDLVVLCVEENRREDAEALADAGVRTASLSIDGVDDVAPALRMLAALVGAEPPAGDLDALDALAADVLPGRNACLRADLEAPVDDPVGRHYGSSLLAAVGVANVYADAADRYPTVTLDEVRARRPESCWRPASPTRSPPATSRCSPTSPRGARDGQDLFWWGARTLDALARLRAQVSTLSPPG